MGWPTVALILGIIFAVAVLIAAVMFYLAVRMMIRSFNDDLPPAKPRFPGRRY